MPLNNSAYHHLPWVLVVLKWVSKVCPSHGVLWDLNPKVLVGFETVPIRHSLPQGKFFTLKSSSYTQGYILCRMTRQCVEYHSSINTLHSNSSFFFREHKPSFFPDCCGFELLIVEMDFMEVF